MSERESTEEDTRVSPYLLRPARTYEEYLRDRAIADRLQQQFQNGPAISVAVTNERIHSEVQRTPSKRPNASADPALAGVGETNRRNAAGNQK